MLVYNKLEDFNTALFLVNVETFEGKERRRFLHFCCSLDEFLQVSTSHD